MEERGKIQLQYTPSSHPCDQHSNLWNFLSTRRQDNTSNVGFRVGKVLHKQLLLRWKDFLPGEHKQMYKDVQLPLLLSGSPFLVPGEKVVWLLYLGVDTSFNKLNPGSKGAHLPAGLSSLGPGLRAWRGSHGYQLATLCNKLSQTPWSETTPIYHLPALYVRSLSRGEQGPLFRVSQSWNHGVNRAGVILCGWGSYSSLTRVVDEIQFHAVVGLRSRFLSGCRAKVALSFKGSLSSVLRGPPKTQLSAFSKPA